MLTDSYHKLFGKRRRKIRQIKTIVRRCPKMYDIILAGNGKGKQLLPGL
jgi:hypothetical protein